MPPATVSPARVPWRTSQLSDIHQFAFEHITTADKFIYEAELRTGAGSHFRYAKHLRDALRCWYAEFPDTAKRIIEGTAEPE